MDEDTTAALEWFDYLDSLCSGCGRPLDECMDRANASNYDAEAVRCFACEARDRLAHRMARDENASTDGLYFVTRDVDTD